MKAVEIIPIARRKLDRRGIPDAWVHETLRTPEQIVPGHGQRLVAQRRWELRGTTFLLRVVYEETATRVTVITAYLTTDIDRYWRRKP
jgi:hypothetical protein